MKREIPESVANAIRTIQSFCDEQLYNNNCDECPFYVKTKNDSFCLFNKVFPGCWNVEDEKHYYIEYDERSIK